MVKALCFGGARVNVVTKRILLAEYFRDSP